MNDVGVFGICKKNGKVLLVKRTDVNMWNLPGGKKGKDETRKQCLAREVKEETGVDVVNAKFVKKYTHSNRVVYTYIIKIKGKFALSNESVDIRWFCINDLPKNLYKKHIERIFDAYSK